MEDIKLKDFIKIYNGVLPAGICSDLIDNFEKHQEDHIQSGMGKDEHHDSYRNAIEMNCSVISDNDVDWKFLTSSLNKVVMDYFNRYMYDMKHAGLSHISIPESNILEEWRMHKYEQGKHYYKKHVDSCDSNSSIRMLSFLFYLNDVEEGGETAFTDHLKGIECKPKQGRLLVFPTWMGFPHEAKEVIKGTKYMIKSYIHYPGELEIE